MHREERISHSSVHNLLQLLLPRAQVPMSQAQARATRLLRSSTPILATMQAIPPQVVRGPRRLQGTGFAQRLELLRVLLDDEIGIVGGSEESWRRKAQVAQRQAVEVSQLAVLGEQTRSTRLDGHVWGLSPWNAWVATYEALVVDSNSSCG